MAYVDAFVLAVERERLDEYRRFAEAMSRHWLENGATAYVQCVADDVPPGELTSFPRAVQAKENEVVVLAWITYPSKEVRDAVNAKLTEDPDLQPPSDTKRMFWGAFQPIIELGKGA